MPGQWTCEIAGEGAQGMTFEGHDGRLRVDVHRGNINREVYRGLLSMRFPKQRLTLTDPFVVEQRYSEPRLLRIYQAGGRGGDVVLRLVDAPQWPKFLTAEIREIFQYKVEPGTTLANLRASGHRSGAKSAGVPKHPKTRPVMSEETKLKIREATRARLAERGIVMKEGTSKSSRQKKRGRKKKVSRGRNHQGLQHLPEARFGDPEGDGPEPGIDARNQEAQPLSGLVITA